MPLAPAPPPAPPPPPSSTVALRLATDPPGAQIYDGDALIGTSPLSLEWPKGKGTRLRFVVPGYAPEFRMIAPQADLDVPLIKLSRTSPRADKREHAVKRPAHAATDLKDAPY